MYIFLYLYFLLGFTLKNFNFLFYFFTVFFIAQQTNCSFLFNKINKYYLLTFSIYVTIGATAYKILKENYNKNNHIRNLNKDLNQNNNNNLKSEESIDNNYNEATIDNLFPIIFDLFNNFIRDECNPKKVITENYKTYNLHLEKLDNLFSTKNQISFRPVDGTNNYVLCTDKTKELLSFNTYKIMEDKGYLLPKTVQEKTNDHFCIIAEKHPNNNEEIYNLKLSLRNDLKSSNINFSEAKQKFCLRVGVNEYHTQLLKKSIFKCYMKMAYPENNNQNKQ